MNNWPFVIHSISNLKNQTIPILNVKNPTILISNLKNPTISISTVKNPTISEPVLELYLLNLDLIFAVRMGLECEEGRLRDSLDKSSHTHQNKYYLLSAAEQEHAVAEGMIIDKDYDFDSEASGGEDEESSDEATCFMAPDNLNSDVSDSDGSDSEEFCGETDRVVVPYNLDSEGSDLEIEDIYNIYNKTPRSSILKIKLFQVLRPSHKPEDLRRRPP